MSILKEVLEKAGIISAEGTAPALTSPTIVMDRGIASKDNLNLLKAHSLDYILVVL